MSDVESEGGENGTISEATESGEETGTDGKDEYDIEPSVADEMDSLLANVPVCVVSNG
jgi:hypothetical protein